MAMIPLSQKRCQYGVLTVTCGAPATTKRKRPAGTATWDVCQRHADFLDRLRKNVTEHKSLLDRLGGYR
jgi:hypothetical protein